VLVVAANQPDRIKAVSADARHLEQQLKTKRQQDEEDALEVEVHTLVRTAAFLLELASATADPGVAASSDVRRAASRPPESPARVFSIRWS
jgi:hypothetical protein